MPQWIGKKQMKEKYCSSESIFPHFGNLKLFLKRSMNFFGLPTLNTFEI